MIIKLLSLFIPLFILMDYIGTIPIFISLTAEKTQKERIRIAILASVIAGLIISVFAILGKPLMHYFGISIEAVKVGGGLLLLYIAFEMILKGQLMYGKDDKGEEKSIIVSPLAIPALSGPGTMTFAIVSNLELAGFEKLYLYVSILLAVICGALLLSASSYVYKLLGKEFTRGLEKITAVVVSFIALEMIMSGIKAYFFTNGT